MPVFAERGQEEAETCEKRETADEQKCKFVFCIYVQCLQSSRSHVGGSNLDFCVEEKFQMTLNPWTGRSQLLPETFKFELRPVWWGAGTERHSPPPSPSWLERY